MPSRHSTCWVVTDGKAGMESPCVGLAEALGLEPIIKRVRMRPLWRLLSPYFRSGLTHAFEDASALVPPWPDILIASGRLSVPASLYVRQQSAASARPTFTIQIQNPVIPPNNFDLVIAPLHDNLAGANVISTVGALHRVTPEKLARESEMLAARLKPLEPPFIGVLVGGPNASYRLGPREVALLAERLSELARVMCARLLVTPSRRTGKENIAALKEKFANVPAFVWDGEGDNPYYGILGCSDYLVVTIDSVNMVSEACATGKPVFLYDLPGGSRKSARFQRALFARSLARNFEIPLVSYAAAPLREMDDVVKAVEAKMRAR